MEEPNVKESKRGVFKKVAAGLYRYSVTGVYFAHVRINGKLFRESLGTDNRKSADRELARFKRDKKKVDPKFRKTTLAQLCERYRETLGKLSKSSRKAKRGILAKLTESWPKGKLQQVADIKPSDCETWLSKQAERVGKSHYNAYVQLLRDVLAIAVRDKMIPENPAGHLKYLKRSKPIRLTPTWEQFQAIVADIRAQQFNADAKDSGDFVEFIGLAGLGQAEAAAITIHHIDLQRGQITAFRHKTQTAFTIPIYPQLRPLVKRLLIEAKQKGREQLLRTKDAKKAIAGACARLKMPAFTHRAFRRMFITRAIEKGIDVKVIAEWQGHTDGGKLILNTYSHVRSVHSQRMALLMGDDLPQPENVIPMGVAR